jgi:hypothetical protein
VNTPAEIVATARAASVELLMGIPDQSTATAGQAVAQVDRALSQLEAALAVGHYESTRQRELAEHRAARAQVDAALPQKGKKAPK